MAELSRNPSISYSESTLLTFQTISTPRVLLVGQTNTAGVTGLYTEIQNKSIEEMEARYGKDQHITRMIKLALKKAQKTRARPIIDVYAFADSELTAGDEATATLLCTAFTESTTLKLTLGNDILTHGILNKYSISIVAGDTGNAVATKIVSAITGDDYALFTAAVDGTNTSQVNLTAKNKGVIFNGVPIFVENQKDLKGGTVTVTGFVDGVGDLNSTIQGNIITAISGIRYNAIVSPYQTQDNIIAELLARNTLQFNKVLDGILFSGISKNNADAQTYYGGEISATRKPFVVGLNGYVDNTQLKGGEHLIEPSLLAVAYGMLYAIVSTSKSDVAEYVLGTNFSYPALFCQKPTHNYVLSYIKHSGVRGDLNIEELKLLNATLLDKEKPSVSSYTVTDKIYTMSTHSQYRTLRDEALSQFLKEFLVTEIGFYTRQYTIFDEVEATSDLRAFAKNLLKVLSGADVLDESSKLLDYQVLLKNKLASAEEVIDEALTVVKENDNTGTLSVTFAGNTVYGIDQVLIALIKQ